MKKVLFVLFAANCVLSSMAQVKTAVTEFNIAGPYAVAAPFGVDTVDVKGKKFDPNSLMSAIALTSQPTGKFSGAVLPSLADSKSVGLLSFYLNNSSYLKGKIEVKGPKHSKLYIDGVEAGGELKLAPEHHTFTIQYLAEPKDTDSIKVVFDTPEAIAYTLESRHPYMVHDLTDGRRVRGINLSADGQLACVAYQTTARGGNSVWSYELREVKTGKLISQPKGNARWMPKSIAWIEEEKDGDKRVLYKVDPRTGVRTRFAYNVPEGGYTIAPNEDYLIVNMEEEGPKEVLRRTRMCSRFWRWTIVSQAGASAAIWPSTI